MDEHNLSRRSFLSLAAAVAALPGACSPNRKEPVAIVRATDYSLDLSRILRQGLETLSITAEFIRGKRIVIKPNLVEPQRATTHINTHPAVLWALIETFKSFGASHVYVAEGSGHVRDAFLVVEESGLFEVLRDTKCHFVDLNTARARRIPNKGNRTTLGALWIPEPILDADLFVSVAKMKTHHWAGVTLSMKNLFGIMPGAHYGWPKNALHVAGIDAAITDINLTMPPHISIIDGIVGMQGDGPIMGNPVSPGLLVMGTNSAALDATGARLMGIRPDRVPHIRMAGKSIGPIRENQIAQRGESICDTRVRFSLLDRIPAHRRISA